MTLPAETLRLFPGSAGSAAGSGSAAAPHPELSDATEEAPFVIGRLLEEGDSEDLRWLCRQYDEASLAAWFEQRSARQLSRRSRAFWSLLLDVAVVDPVDDSLWPL